MLTTSPVNNTTHDFILPNELFDEYEKAVFENMSSLASLVKSIVEIEEVKSMVLFTVEGKDIEFKKIKTNSSEIHEAIKQDIDGSYYVPSMMFEVVK